MFSSHPEPDVHLVLPLGPLLGVPSSSLNPVVYLGIRSEAARAEAAHGGQGHVALATTGGAAGSM